MLHVLKLPRKPFLPHSERLLRHFLASQSGCEFLEIGCGNQSPLVDMLRRLRPEARLDQIDARAEVIHAARRHNPRGRVERMTANDMSGIPETSKDGILAMSVFDQNPASAMKEIALQMHRVLRDDGVVVYIHNEELNAPATCASFRACSQYLIPSNRWQPTNDWEYCSGNVYSVEHSLVRLGSRGIPLKEYIQTFHTRERQQRSGVGKLSVPLASRLSGPDLQQLRTTVQTMRDAHRVPLTDRSTGDLLSERVERQLLNRVNGFEVIESGVFEIQIAAPCQRFLQNRPNTRHFVRGITKFGYTCHQRPSPNPRCVQHCNDSPVMARGEILFVAYQYGVLARKVPTGHRANTR